MSINKKRSSEKSFGLLFFLFFAIIAIYSFQNYSLFLGLVFLFASILFLILGLQNSKLLIPLNVAWCKLGIMMSIVITPIVLSLIYLITVVPIGLLLKLFNKDILDLSINKKLDSYWKIRKENNFDMSKQF